MRTSAVARAMHRIGLIAAGCATLSPLAIAQTGVAAPAYPPTPRGTQADDVAGVRIADPYRWLESLNSPQVRSWIAAENAATESFFAQAPRRKEIRDRLTNAENYPKIGAPFSAGERLFFYENGGLENQPTLYVRDRAEGAPRLLIVSYSFW